MAQTWSDKMFDALFPLKSTGYGPISHQILDVFATKQNAKHYPLVK